MGRMAAFDQVLRQDTRAKAMVRYFITVHPSYSDGAFEDSSSHSTYVSSTLRSGDRRPQVLRRTTSEEIAAEVKCKTTEDKVMELERSMRETEDRLAKDKRDLACRRDSLDRAAQNYDEIANIRRKQAIQKEEDRRYNERRRDSGYYRW